MARAASRRVNGSVGVIQGDVTNSVILQIINNIGAPADLDQAARKMADHADALRKRKAWMDVRLLLGVFAVAFFFMGTHLGGMALPILYICGVALILCGYRLTSTLYRLDAEISAAQGLLVEFYKRRLERQLQGL